MDNKIISVAQPSKIKALAAHQVAERDIRVLKVYSIEEGAAIGHDIEWHSVRPFEGNGEINLTSNSIYGRFSGELATYQIKVNLVATNDVFNGLSVAYRVSGWKSIRYVAIGHSTDTGFRHVKIANIKQGTEVITNFGYADIAYGLQNKWQKLIAGALPDVRVYISGEPDADATIEIFWVSRWQENNSSIVQTLVSQNTPNNPELFSALKEYFIRCNSFLEQHAIQYMAKGDLPISGEVYLKWDYNDRKPKNLSDTGTYSYAWHAMHLAISLMVYGTAHQKIEAIFAARDIITSWLNDSFYNADTDTKYTWYDHGTAERLIAFIFMHYIGSEYNFDHRFMTRLQHAIVKHAQLLESEVFYAYHQRTRYHNHAWFQDMALIAAAVAFKDWPVAERWLKVGISRLEDQLANLIVRDSGFAIFIENSIGYHLGVQRLTDFAGALVQLSKQNSAIPEISLELDKWSAFFRYPDHTLPANGDTFKKSLADKLYRLKPYQEQGLTLLSKAGYAVLKQNVNGKPLMLTMLGSSLCKTHKHEDNLAITLFHDGVEWLTDPSFHSHNYSDELPAYLRSAEAHCCIFVPGVDYSLEPNLCYLDSSEQEENWIISGEHTCYDDIRILRTINVCKDKLVILGSEEIRSVRPYDAAYLVFHLGEGVVVSEIDDGYMLSHHRADTKAVLKVQKDNCDIITGMNFPEHSSIIGIGFEEFVESTSICIRLESSKAEWTISFI